MPLVLTVMAVITCSVCLNSGEIDTDAAFDPRAFSDSVSERPTQVGRQSLADLPARQRALSEGASWRSQDGRLRLGRDCRPTFFPPDTKPYTDMKNALSGLVPRSVPAPESGLGRERENIENVPRRDRPNSVNASWRLRSVAGWVYGLREPVSINSYSRSLSIRNSWFVGWVRRTSALTDRRSLHFACAVTHRAISNRWVTRSLSRALRRCSGQACRRACPERRLGANPPSMGFASLYPSYDEYSLECRMELHANGNRSNSGAASPVFE